MLTPLFENIVEILKETKNESISSEDRLNSLVSKLERELKHPQHPIDLYDIECGYGWYGIIFPIIAYIEEYNKKHEDNPIIIYQIKEKFGGLRFYTSYSTPELDKMIEEAEDWSFLICENCGSPVNVTTKGPNWITTLCDKCRNKD